MAPRITVTARIDQAGVRRFLLDPGSPVVQLVVRTTRAIYNRAVMRSPVDKGILRNSHEIVPLKIVGMTAVSGVTNNANYAGAVHNGSRPHVIEPRTRTVLAWGGAPPTIFARRVNHPGSRPRPWLANAAKAEGERAGFNFRAR